MSELWNSCCLAYFGQFLTSVLSMKESEHQKRIMSSPVNNLTSLWWHYELFRSPRGGQPESLIPISYWSQSLTSASTHKMSSACEVPVSFLWGVKFSWYDPFVRYILQSEIWCYILKTIIMFWPLCILYRVPHIHHPMGEGWKSKPCEVPLISGLNFDLIVCEKT